MLSKSTAPIHPPVPNSPTQGRGHPLPAQLMTDVIGFPNFGARTWNEIESSLRNHLLLAGGPPGFADWVCNDIRPRAVALQAQWQLILPASIAPTDAEELAHRVTSMVRECTNRALGEILEIEIDLYFALHVGGAKPPAGKRGDRISGKILEFVAPMCEKPK